VPTSTRDNKWQLHDILITIAGKVYVPLTSPPLPTVLGITRGAAHEGVAKTLHRLRLDFHVPGAQQAVQDFVHACATF
jgi:hypothetical protein